MIMIMMKTTKKKNKKEKKKRKRRLFISATKGASFDVEILERRRTEKLSVMREVVLATRDPVLSSI